MMYNVLLLTKAGAQSHREETETDANILPFLYGNDGWESLKPALPQLLQASDGTKQEGPYITVNI